MQRLLAVGGVGGYMGFVDDDEFGLAHMIL